MTFFATSFLGHGIFTFWIFLILCWFGLYKQALGCFAVYLVAIVWLMIETKYQISIPSPLLLSMIYKLLLPAMPAYLLAKIPSGKLTASLRKMCIRDRVVAAFRGKAKTAFTLKAQYKRAATASLADADRNPFQWNAEVIFGRDAEEYTILYHQCGLCALGRQEGLPHLVPYLCALDTMLSLIHILLRSGSVRHRRTASRLAEGADLLYRFR